MFLKAKQVLYFVCERHLFAAYTFAVRWRDMVERDMGTRGLTREDAKDRKLWKTGTRMRVPTPQCGKV
jgi:hypothetical protein